ncbi:2-oxoacid dehydrogenase/acyltransferase catalytic subunit [Kribbella amoyensis]|uniref:2-oxoacid dehydrogenase/acyltransferase catalytic subunit n=1 Tax=Kribbella amoyensis TaxID=996641 RepID=A0A561BUE2_9ACTN|nr:2-oxo acid dehydrogenase subunit E2 [Kribbella amoyensis]TWD82525.1 2-oxoacid dehydrogenase/acyltransferase catalytic subunit [Kribbella amoyensis]
MRHVESKIVRVPWVRQLVIDTGRAAHHRHAIHGLFEVDVTSARDALSRQGHAPSFTAFVIHCVARAVAADPGVQAYRDLRGREVVFDQVDIGVPVEVDVEGTPFAFTHVLRDAARRTVDELSRELHQVKTTPGDSPSVRKASWARAYLVLPGFVRVGLLGGLHRWPYRQRALAGTVGVTAVGMFGAGGGWGIGFQLHTLSVVVGGITRRPILFQGRLVEREFLQLTVSVDHDIVDGAPTARFVRRLRELLTAADGIVPDPAKGARAQKVS